MQKKQDDNLQKSGLTRRDLFKASLAVGAAAALYPTKAHADGELALTPKFYPLDTFTPDLDLTGKVAVITGASRGLGKATGEALTALGAEVIGTSRNVATVQDPPTAYPLLDLDIAEPQSVKKFMSALKRELYDRNVDILINNAARHAWGDIIPPSPEKKQKHYYYYKQFKLACDTIYHGHVGMTAEIMPLMPTTGYARILYTISIVHILAGGGSTDVVPGIGAPFSPFISYLQPYNSAKRALYVYANHLRARLQYAGSNFKVSTVSPFAIKTDIAEGTQPIFLEPTDENGYTGDPEHDQFHDVMRAIQQGGIPPSTVGDTYGQLLRMNDPTPNVVVGSPDEPYASMGGNELVLGHVLSENPEADVSWECS